MLLELLYKPTNSRIGSLNIPFEQKSFLLVFPLTSNIRWPRLKIGEPPKSKNLPLHLLHKTTASLAAFVVPMKSLGSLEVGQKTFTKISIQQIVIGVGPGFGIPGLLLDPAHAASLSSLELFVQLGWSSQSKPLPSSLLIDQKP